MTNYIDQLNSIQHALSILLLGILGAVLFEMFVRRFLVRLVRKTPTLIDDAALRILRHPLAATSILYSGILAIEYAHPPAWVLSMGTSFLETILIVIWARVFLQAGHFFLEEVARPDGPTQVHIHPRSIPIFDFVIKLGVYAMALYLGLAAWGFDISNIATSFGLATVAVGFAAQESLANVFAGVLIIADAPYQIGDILELDNGDRGEVVEIGMRSTRLITNDGVEIIVPNNIMANTRVINESGGPVRHCRIHVPIGIAYGTDLRVAKKVLEDGLRDLPGVLYGPPGAPPMVVLKDFGASSVDLEVLAWIAEPRDTLMMRDAINVAIYNALHDANIEIPFPQQDVRIYASATSPGPVTVEAPSAPDRDRTD